MSLLLVATIRVPTAAGVLALTVGPVVAGLYPYCCWHVVFAYAGIPSVAGKSTISILHSFINLLFLFVLTLLFAYSRFFCDVREGHRCFVQYNTAQGNLTVLKLSVIILS
jgi:hypothetical protein